MKKKKVNRKKVLSQFKCADGQSKDNGAHQLIDYLSYGGVSGREQSAV